MTYILICMILGGIMGYKIELKPLLSAQEESKHRLNNFFVAALFSTIIALIVYHSFGYSIL